MGETVVKKTKIKKDKTSAIQKNATPLYIPAESYFEIVSQSLLTSLDCQSTYLWIYGYSSKVLPQVIAVGILSTPDAWRIMASIQLTQNENLDYLRGLFALCYIWNWIKHVKRLSVTQNVCNVIMTLPCIERD